MSVSFYIMLERSAWTDLPVMNAVGVAACAGTGSVHPHMLMGILLRTKKEGKGRACTLSWRSQFSACWPCKNLQ